MLGITGADPAFRDDDGSADPRVTAALARFTACEGSEHAVLTALAGSRLLVPVVAVLAEDLGERPAPGGEKASEMAMPTLIGMDGRRAVPAFTCLDSMCRWQRDARPVPAAALAVWQAAAADSCAVVIDVAGPTPFAVEGARLEALARGVPAPLPYADPDVREAVSAVLAGRLEVASFDLAPGTGGHDLTVILTLEPAPGRDVTSLAAGIGEAVMARLGGRLRRGIAIVADQ